MEPASALHFMSFKKKLRQGQEIVFKALVGHREKLNIKLPTGYGKTFTCVGVYSILRAQGRVNRLLVIFPTDKQLDQFLLDAEKDDLPKANVDPPWTVVDVRTAGIYAVRDHRRDARQIFAITIQSLIQPHGANTVKELLSTGLWMICVDEHHHYGNEKSWGRAVHGLLRQFLLVMSATPFRPSKDEAFGPPDIAISYRDAHDEGAVKKLIGHAYHYRMDIEVDGKLRQYTTAELAAEAGSDDADKIEALRIERKMRWSPKYVSPLMSIPIERMISERLRTGLPLQVLITAMCVSHAEYVCQQVADMYPDLRIDWVGTGAWGRTDEENRQVLQRFCPSKDDNGDRPPPTLDVLVHVGMAGEGLDSIYVSEVVHLSNASFCNRTNQVNGRAARFLKDVVGHINFDATSEYVERGYLGEGIMLAMDQLPALRQDPKPPDDDDEWPPVPPEEPTVILLDLEFVGVDSGDAGVRAFARFLQERQPDLYPWQEMKTDTTHPSWQPFIDDWKAFRRVEAEQYNNTARVAQVADQVKQLFSQNIGLVARLRTKEGLFVDKTVVGRIAHLINREKMKRLGPLNEKNQSLDVAEAHYRWLWQLNAELRKTGAPAWLRF
jgi:superfamily II DNA or RNA helicase